MAKWRSILLTASIIMVAACPAGRAGAQEPAIGCCFVSSSYTCGDLIPADVCATASGSFVAGGTCQGGTPYPGVPNVFIGGTCGPSAAPAPAMSTNVLLGAAAMLAAVGMLRLARRRRDSSS